MICPATIWLTAATHEPSLFTTWPSPNADCHRHFVFVKENLCLTQGLPLPLPSHPHDVLFRHREVRQKLIVRRGNGLPDHPGLPGRNATAPSPIGAASHTEGMCHRPSCLPHPLFKKFDLPHTPDSPPPNPPAISSPLQFFHCLTGLFFAVCCVNLPRNTWTSFCLLLTILSFTVEIIRVSSPTSSLNKLFMSSFRAFARASEQHEISGTPYYMLGMLLASSLFSTPAATVGILCLACLDPVAAMAGTMADQDMPRARLTNGKSLAGFVFAACVGAAVSAVTLAQAAASSMSQEYAVAVGVLAGFAGASAELMVPTPRVLVGPKRVPITIDDNALIPVVAACVCEVLLSMEYHQVQLSPILFWKVSR